MRIIQQFIPILLFLSLLTSCQSVHEVNITFQGKETLSFTGRGSAAGMMMDSLMPGGIAIGIAIDEGIAKEIYKNLLEYSPDFSIEKLIRSHLNKHPNSNLKSIQIKTYGFRNSIKGEDQVSAWLDVEFVCKNKNVGMNYPADFSDIATADFKSFKESEKVSFEMLNQAIKIVIGQLNDSKQC